MKRTNKPFQEYFLVYGGNQNLQVLGTLQTATTTVNIADQQGGLIAAQNFGTYQVGEFVAAADTIADIPSIKIVQGTPNATDNSGVYGWFHEDKGWLETPVIESNSILSVMTKLPTSGVYSSVLHDAINATITDSTEYGIHVFLRSVRRDRDYGRNQDQMTRTYTTGDVSAVTDPIDLVLQNLGYKLNLQSRLANIQPEYIAPTAKKPWVAFVIDQSGSSIGTPIGTIALGDVIPLQVDSAGNQTNFVADKAFLNTIFQWIANYTGITATSTIENIDLANAGEGAPAVGTITMTNVANLAGDTFTIDTTALVEGVDWARGASTTTAATALTAAINASATLNGVVKATSSGAVVTVVAETGGTGGNSIVFTYTDGGTAGATISGAGTLAGGENTQGDAIIVMGIDEAPVPQAYSDIYSDRTTIESTFGIGGAATGSAFQADSSVVSQNLSDMENPAGTGKLLRIWYDNRAFGQTGSQQLTGFADEVLKAPNYIVEATDYTVSAIDWQTLVDDPQGEGVMKQQHRVWILVPATDDSGSATGATGITTSTADTTTVTDLNAVLGVWLESNDPFDINGDAAAGALFV